MESKKTRRYHNRSRAGCDSCKHRHIRCDENRPVCINCVTAGRSCGYLNEEARNRGIMLRKQLPGVSVWQLPNLMSTDPFDSLPIKMELRSTELFHYFVRERSSSARKSSIQDPTHGCIALRSKEPLAFRNMLILAAIHYSWISGGMETFQETFLHHKGESLRHADQLLREQDPKTRVDCLRLVATLSVVESCIGNVAAAEVHLQGLLTLLDMSISISRTQERDNEVEISHRLFLTAHHFLSAVKSRTVGLEALPNHRHELWRRSFTSLRDNLTGLRLMTSCLSSIPSGGICKVDTRIMLAAIGGLTNALDVDYDAVQPHYLAYTGVSGRRSICNGDDSANCLGCKSLAALMCENMRTNINSLHSEANTAHTSMTSSWCGIIAAQSLYLHYVLDFWNGGQPVHPRTLYRLLSMVQMDLELAGRETGSDEAKLWLWKAFIACYAILTVPLKHIIDENMYLFRHFFFLQALRWTTFLGIKSWESAKSALADVTWSLAQRNDEIALRVWQETMTMSMSFGAR